jgi:hypothetical protein
MKKNTTILVSLLVIGCRQGLQLTYYLAVDNYIDSNKKLRLITDIGAAIKSLLTIVGLFAACVLATYAVMYKSRSLGDFVVLLTYWEQLQGI